MQIIFEINIRELIELVNQEGRQGDGLPDPKSTELQQEIKSMIGE